MDADKPTAGATVYRGAMPIPPNSFSGPAARSVLLGRPDAGSDRTRQAAYRVYRGVAGAFGFQWLLTFQGVVPSPSVMIAVGPGRREVDSSSVTNLGSREPRGSITWSATAWILMSAETSSGDLSQA